MTTPEAYERATIALEALGGIDGHELPKNLRDAYARAFNGVSEFTHECQREVHGDDS